MQWYQPNYWQWAWNAWVSRRRLLRGALAAGAGAAALALVGCGGEDEARRPSDEPSGSPESTPQPPPATAPSGRPVETRVTITGTGVPIADPDRAGPGVLVEYGEVRLQFDAGRATVMRLAAHGRTCGELSAVFITHHHSDHLLGFDDIVLTRWIQLSAAWDNPLPVVAPKGPSAHFVKGVTDRWEDDIDVRQRDAGRETSPSVSVTEFDAPTSPQVVWSQGDVRVSSIRVEHPSVEPSVAYRVDTPTGSVVFSGDTRVCPAMEEISTGADIVVHEALRSDLLRGSPYSPLIDYHADTLELGQMAARLRWPVLILTHLIPPPANEKAEMGFADDVRHGGYDGTLVVARDLYTATCPLDENSDEARDLRLRSG